LEPFQIIQFFEVFHSRSERFIDGFARLIGALSIGSRKETFDVAYWLMKSEPENYGWADLVRDGGTEWDGVRNNAARLHLKAMKVGDEAFFYHSMSDKAVVGITRVTRGAEPDPKAPDWVRVRVEPVRALPRPVTLAEIKAEPRLAKMELIRQSRLSVAPVRDEEWAKILGMAGE
jgi:predicted RNA-binding protein with PUA-like domain